MNWLAGYTPRRLAPDTIAGLSLAAFVIPESLAYATLAGLPPVTGLYCYLVAGIASLAGGDPARAVALASGVALMVGVICVIGRFVGFANFAYFLSDAVIA